MRKDHIHSSISERRAFTLVELLVVIAVLAVLAGGAYMVVSNVSNAGRQTKLEADVATLNRAIVAYESNGGSIAGLTTVDAVLAKLKTVSSHKMPGMSGRAIDARLSARTQSSAEAASTDERAVFDSATGKFVVVTSGSGGVKEFFLDDAAGAAAATPEDRVSAIRVAEDNSWIWDSQAATPVPRAPGPTPPSTTAGSDTSPNAAGTMTLQKPTFSPAEGSYELPAYDLSVTIGNPNPSGVAEIWYSVEGSAFERYLGQTITVEPGQTVTAYAKTIDPDHWSDSDHEPAQYEVEPYALEVSLDSEYTQLTYQQAGGAFEGVTPSTAPSATVTVSNVSQIASKYLTSDNFELVWTYDGTDPTSSASAQVSPAFSGTVPTGTISLDIANWPSNAAMQLKAAVRAKNTSLYASSAVSSTTVNISPTALASPTIDPASGNKAVDYPVTLAFSTSQSQPTGAQIYYTTDGTTPGNNNGVHVGGTLYSGPFNSGDGDDGVVVVTARAYGPTAYTAWFTPSSAASATYSSITLADGALVGSATLNGTFVGSIVYASPSSGGTMSDITFNSNAKILQGNLYLPGQPTVKKNGPSATWSTANDSQFSSVIQGWEFDSNNNKTVQTTPRVLDETGSITPNNYTITFNGSSLLEGKVIRRHTAPAFPTIASPPPPDSSGSISLNSAPSGPISASQYSSVTINTSSVGDVRLLAGHYSNLTANNGTAFVLGDPDNPDVTQVYSFQSLTLNSSSDLKIVGKVIVTVSGSINLNSGSVLGNSSHPEWLQLQMSSGNFTANSGSYAYAQLVAPNGSVTFNSGSVFQGSVTANALTINSSGVVFNLPPVIEN